MVEFCTDPARRSKITAVALSLLLVIVPQSFASADDASLLRSIAQEGHIVIMRHAVAPGTGDPNNFTLRDCSTQRNLSVEGRAQAARIGARLRDAGLGSARVFSSQWCRCLETAELLKLGAVEELPPLNSFFRQREQQPAATNALREWLRDQPSDEPLVLVTHQVNITALTDVFPRSGEMIVLERSGSGEFPVVGRIETE